MLLLFRATAMASALALSTAAFAGNEEGNKPLNNVAATTPHMYAPENRSVPEGRAAAEDRAPRHHKALHRYGEGGNTSGMSNSQYPQSNY